MKKITQIYYPSSTDSDLRAKLINGKLFEGMDIYRLGIQTLPGVKFYLQESNVPIIVGADGRFDFDLVNTPLTITALQFDKQSMNMIDNANISGYLIVDIIYEKEE